MVKKDAVRYVCSSCGAVSATWSGRCYNCGEWNTLQEQLDISSQSVGKGGHTLTTQTVSSSLAKDHQRLVSGISEFDNVFGSGIVAGSVNLIAGQPGIGKSTLLLQLAHALAKSTTPTKAKITWVGGTGTVTIYTASTNTVLCTGPPDSSCTGNGLTVGNSVYAKDSSGQTTSPTPITP